MVQEVFENVYSIEVELPNNPLRWLNSYYIDNGGTSRDLLIDTGFNMPECRRALLAGMQELNIDPQNTDLFITHLHSDHCGNADMLEQMGCRIIMGRDDYAHLGTGSGHGWEDRRVRALEDGMSNEDFENIFLHNPAVQYLPKPFHARLVDDGNVLPYGRFSFECIETPGHTPGHMCLFDREKSLMFTGDHILFDISPNITFWPSVKDSLTDYIISLDKVRSLNVATALPGHRNCGRITANERIDQLFVHHEKRLAELEQMIREEPGLNGYELAGKMRWKIRATNWADFPPAQKWFAYGEALAHLDYLVNHGRVRREVKDGLSAYYADI